MPAIILPAAIDTLRTSMREICSAVVRASEVRSFKMIYTDRYAVRVWLPGMLGLMKFILGLVAEPVAINDVLFGGFFILWAGYELYLRRTGKSLKG